MLALMFFSSVAGWRRRCRQWVRGAGVAAVVGASLFAGCALQRSGTALPCTVDSDCASQGPCTTGVCSASGICQYVPAADGPASQQLPGDCHVVGCVAGQPQRDIDDTDVPIDHDPCTADVCTSGVPTNPAKAEGASCEAEGGQVGTCVSGTCTVACIPGAGPGQCDDGNACTEGACDPTSGTCVQVPINNVVVSPEPDGDCQVLLCQDGTETTLSDNTDLPDDGNECTSDLCVEGMASHPPANAGAPCAQNGGRVCDGDSNNPQCVECLTAFHCEAMAPSNACRSWTCTAAHTCQENLVPAGTPLSALKQATGDCQQLVCDGNGNISSQIDDTDVPLDGNDCTDDLCSGGVPSNPSSPPNQPCGANGALYCDGAGSCVNCTDDVQCGTDTFCRNVSCLPDGTCSIFNVSAGTPLPAADQTSHDCVVIQCDGMGNAQVAIDDTDLPSDDGNECTADECMGGAAVHPAKLLDTPCTQGGGV
ncbi:MAG TPA: hypothetical protein ENK23_08710, partial [Sorangium sp.]|nr:hypothetical protein [Sorangium sp.]